MPIDEVNELLNVDLPHEEWDTVGGLVFGLTGRVPYARRGGPFDSLEFVTETGDGTPHPEGRDQEGARAPEPASSSDRFVPASSSIVGRPNVGKSTLVNALVGEKVAITSDKPQTTRSAIRGVLNGDGVQIVFIDTPGYHKPRTLLGRRLNEVVRAAWARRGSGSLRGGRQSRGRPRGPEGRRRPRGGELPGVLHRQQDRRRQRKDQVAVALAAASRLGDFDEYIPTSRR